MDFQQLMQKAETEGLAPEEQTQVVSLIEADLNRLKGENPEQYLQLLKTLNGLIEGFNEDLKSI